MDERHVASKDIGGNHSGEVDRILRAAELWRVAKFGFFEIVDGCAHLDGHRHGADALVHRRTVLAERLRPRRRPSDFRKIIFNPSILASG